MVRMDENSGHRVCHLVSFFSESGLCEASQEPTRDNEIFNCNEKSELFPAFKRTYEKIFMSLEENEKKLDLIIIDELGTAESSDKNFQMRVQRLLDSNTPVLGVLQRCNSEFIERIKAREDVVLYTIDVNNREEMLSVIRDAVSREIGVKKWN